MDTWPVLVALVVALGGGIYFLAQPLPLDYKNGEYRRHLTPAEEAALLRGEVVEKTHKAYQSIWHTYYDQGPLRVARSATGKLAFTPHGHWQRLTKTGRVEADFYQQAIYPEAAWRQYLANGQPNFTMYTIPTLLAGDSVVENRFVQFKATAAGDTAYVQHWFTKGTKEVRPAYFSFDWRGEKPVPPGWKPTKQ
ncbi:hypothetical protein SAMN00120144_4222 [Hymenobacter roseosalivarius DSM 11622]|uniref:Uncharacterized protein n=1 Tax=Hymenobacter roseosalivarius DSM 11622 TaxID=645990 RepID=A0A1W1UG51_9BACT|nr:hypothetical protein [Hymenobacter roseosalivarius]SMB79791.1 hypothetical protein SAMN00120144_4222 [Hymenobacter roseosalivarius DSM 11622]